MAINFVDVRPSPALAWGDVLEALADCIKLHIDVATTGARVYPYWVYEIDSMTLLGKVTAPMMATKGTSAGKVHCWTLGLSAANVQVNPVDGQPPAIGTNAFSWLVTVDVWGFWNFDGSHAAQQQAMNEARLVSAAIMRNRDVLRSSITFLSDVRPLNFTALQPNPFSDGRMVSVATGALQMVVNQEFNV